MEISGTENVTRTASPTSTMTNRIALPFEDHLEERFRNSQNFFQRHHMCLGRNGTIIEQTHGNHRYCCSNPGVDFVVLPLRSDLICRRMRLKKVLADTKIPFQLIPERQHIPIRHVGDRAAKKCQLVPRRRDLLDAGLTLPLYPKGWEATRGIFHRYLLMLVTAYELPSAIQTVQCR